MKATKRFSHGLQAGGAFTFAKGFTRATRQDFFNPAEQCVGPATDPAAGADLQLRLHHAESSVPEQNRKRHHHRLADRRLRALPKRHISYASGQPHLNFLTSEDVRVAGQPLYNVNINNIHSYNPATTQVLNPLAWWPDCSRGCY